VLDGQVVAVLVPGLHPRLLVARQGGNGADAHVDELTMARPAVFGVPLRWRSELRVTEGLVWERDAHRVVVRWVDGDVTIVARPGRLVSPSPWGLAKLATVSVSTPDDSPFALAHGRHRGVVVDGRATPPTPARTPAPTPRPLLGPRPVVTDPALSSPVPSGA
jgi:hypothetical protein